MWNCNPDSLGTVSLIGKPKVKRGDILEVRYLRFPSRKLCQARFERAFAPMSLNIECTTAQLNSKRRTNNASAIMAGELNDDAERARNRARAGRARLSRRGSADESASARIPSAEQCELRALASREWHQRV
jgi:hypothetical protein